MWSTVGSRNLRVITISVCVVSAFFLIRAWLFTGTNRPTVDNYSEYKAAFVITRACILNEILASDSEQFWNRSLTAINSCTANTNLNMVKWRNMDENKTHIPAKVEGTTCNIITLGVGRDTAAETKMLEKMPHCNFFGADPASELNQEIYSKVGKFFHTAVGAEDAELTQLVYETEAKNNWTHYHNKVVPVRDLYNFVREDAKLSVVDQIMIDIEKTEYDIVNKLLRRNTPQDIIFCQINVEFHPKDAEARKIYFEFLKNLVEEGDILPLRMSSNWRFSVRRLFFLNIRDPVCQERYFYHAEDSKALEN